MILSLSRFSGNLILTLNSHYNLDSSIANYIHRKTGKIPQDLPILMVNGRIIISEELGIANHTISEPIKLVKNLNKIASEVVLRPKPNQFELIVEDVMNDFERKVIVEINSIRTEPLQYAAKLEKYLHLNFKEGVNVLNEAINEVKNSKPKQIFNGSVGLNRAALEHTQDTGPLGILGHIGSTGSTPNTRASRYGQGEYIGENVAYGAYTPEEFVAMLVIDDGVPSRGHRRNILNPLYNQIGVSIGYHNKYEKMCVIAFANGYIEKHFVPQPPIKKIWLPSVK